MNKAGKLGCLLAVVAAFSLSSCAQKKKPAQQSQYQGGASTCAEDPNQDKCRVASGGDSQNRENPENQSSVARDSTVQQSGDFDVCRDGLASVPSQLTQAVKLFCDQNFKQQVDNKVYTKVDYGNNDSEKDKAKIVRTQTSSPDAKDQITYTLFMAMDLMTQPKDYYELVRLQQMLPDIFADNYETDSYAKVCNVKRNGDNASELEYKNTKSSDLVHYTVAQDYKELRANESYLVTSLLQENFEESVRDLRAINISIKNGTTTRLYIISYQQVFRNGQSSDVIIDKALNHMRDDLRRTFYNASRASLAAQLFNPANSNPATSCD